MNKQDIYLFAPHRSGTNFLNQLINLNYNYNNVNSGVLYNKLWKHSCLGGHSVSDETPIIVIYKNIYTWLESVLIRKPMFGLDFIQSLKHLDKDKYDQIMELKCKFYFINGNISLSCVVEAYINFYKQFLNCGKDVTYIKYEDLLYDNSLERVFKRLDQILTRKTSELRMPKKVHLSPNFSDVNKPYYKEGKPTFLNGECLQIIDNLMANRLEELDKQKI